MNIKAIVLSSDVDRVAHLLDIFIGEANKGYPAIAMNQRLPRILEIAEAEYMRLLLLAVADGLITTVAKPANEGADTKDALFPHKLTEAGELYLEAWQDKGPIDPRWPNAWIALEKSGKPLTPANMLGYLREKGSPGRRAQRAE